MATTVVTCRSRHRISVRSQQPALREGEAAADTQQRRGGEAQGDGNVEPAFHQDGKIIAKALAMAECAGRT